LELGRHVFIENGSKVNRRVHRHDLPSLNDPTTVAPNMTDVTVSTRNHRPDMPLGRCWRFVASTGMSFFEELPPPPPPSARQWGAPAWDRPSEGTLPAIVPVEEVLIRTDAAVVQLDLLRVYPNGFTINLFIVANPQLEQHRGGLLHGPGADGMRRMPRIGVRFSDGRTAGREAGFGPSPFDVPKDENGLPTVPIIRMTGGGGGSHGYHFGVWVYPLPPAGPLEIYVSLPVADESEKKVVLDGEAIRAAAARAHVIWT
jgi:hypothetical protein